MTCWLPATGLRGPIRRDAHSTLGHGSARCRAPAPCRSGGLPVRDCTEEGKGKVCPQSSSYFFLRQPWSPRASLEQVSSLCWECREQGQALLCPLRSALGPNTSPCTVLPHCLFPQRSVWCLERWSPHRTAAGEPLCWESLQLG